MSFVAVALDTDDWGQFETWCRQLGRRAGVLKVGLQAWMLWREAAVEEALRSGADVFLDLKLHDIPNTVAGATRAAAALGVQYLTVHAAGGRRMLEAAAEAADGRVALLGVTVLTHLAADELAEVGWSDPVADRVEALAALARDSGVTGVVCSPHEVERLRAMAPAPFRLVTPGIRFSSGAVSQDDQRRVATPASALRSGADLLVIGRGLTRADDLDRAWRELEESRLSS